MNKKFYLHQYYKIFRKTAKKRNKKGKKRRRRKTSKTMKNNAIRKRKGKQKYSKEKGKRRERMYGERRRAWRENFKVVLTLFVQ